MQTDNTPSPKAPPTGAALRVAIAKDVLAALDAKRIVPDCVYLVGRIGGEEPCRVCALGAVFVAAVERGCAQERFTYPGDCGRGMREALAGHFGKKQLVLIECAYEMDASFAEDHDIPGALVRAAVNFGRRCGDEEDFGWGRGDEEDRMRAIMKNIIANGGTFKP